MLNGLHEVQAGILEGATQNSGIPRIFYALVPVTWTLGLYGVPMIGSPDATGANFQSRFNGAVNTMYADGGANPVAFSHGMSIMAWTLMNVKNPDISLMLRATLSNTDTVIRGAKPPADAIVPPTGSQLGDSTGVPLSAAARASESDATVASQKSLPQNELRSGGVFRCQGA